MDLFIWQCVQIKEVWDEGAGINKDNYRTSRPRKPIALAVGVSIDNQDFLKKRMDEIA